MKPIAALSVLSSAVLAIGWGLVALLAGGMRYLDNLGFQAANAGPEVGAYASYSFGASVVFVVTAVCLTVVFLVKETGPSQPMRRLLIFAAVISGAAATFFLSRVQAVEESISTLSIVILAVHFLNAIFCLALAFIRPMKTQENKRAEL